MVNFKCKVKEKRHLPLLLASVREWDLLVLQAIACSEVPVATFTLGKIILGFSVCRGGTGAILAIPGDKVSPLICVVCYCPLS